MTSQVFRALGAQIGRSNIKDGFRAACSFLIETVGCPCISCQNASRELGVGIQLEIVLNDALVFLIPSVDSAPDDKSPVGSPAWSLPSSSWLIK